MDKLDEILGDLVEEIRIIRKYGVDSTSCKKDEIEKAFAKAKHNIIETIVAELDKQIKFCQMHFCKNRKNCIECYRSFVCNQATINCILKIIEIEKK